MIRKKWSLEGYFVSNDAMFSKSLWDKVYTDWRGEAAAGQQETQSKKWELCRQVLQVLH